MKTQTKERIHLLIQDLDKTKNNSSADEETWNTITEIARLLEEDVETGSRTQGVLSDISAFGEDLLKKDQTERDQMLQERMPEIDEYVSHLKKEADRSGV
ncbi:hypothetical protein ACFFJY_19365 [Fictibacillus aquaticus]|uniref:Uncharacterized protein n=1 Tax=Fictibacillus aquaticus TaxID=2021314 RepID=A0A235F4Z4_9BACL|nr:hypothetical protein [Fictibacillus aquaticus]OYD56302.1 hypothetical protein CGZ90_18305 [Fictibacillus aquaticus]